MFKKNPLIRVELTQVAHIFHVLFPFQAFQFCPNSCHLFSFQTLYSNLPFLPRWAGISRRSVSLCVDITSEYFPRVDYVPN